MNRAVKQLLKAAVFVVCLALVINGQKQIGIPGFSIMLVGLAGMLGLLFVYNRQYN